MFKNQKEIFMALVQGKTIVNTKSGFLTKFDPRKNCLAQSKDGGYLWESPVWPMFPLDIEHEKLHTEKETYCEVLNLKDKAIEGYLRKKSEIDTTKYKILREFDLESENV